MRLRLAVPLAAMVAGLIVFAGCGGGDDSTTTVGASGASGEQGPALTKSEFLAQGNAICAKGDKEIDAAASKTFAQGQEPSKADQETFVNDTLVPNVQGQVDALSALSPPSGDEDQVQQIVDAAQSGIDKIKADPSLATQQDGSDPFAEANKLADDYGLDKCGSDS